MEQRLPEATVEIEIPFHDLDPLNVAWHGHYFKYFELARVELLRSINYDYPEMHASRYAWPVIEVQCRYFQPLRYGMKARVTAKLVEYQSRMKIAYEIVDIDSEKRICSAVTSQVAVNMEKQEMCFASPQVLLEKLGVSS